MLGHHITRLQLVSSLLLLLLRANPIQASTYFVATTGNDSNPGSQPQPFLTIQHGLTAARNGDVVLVSPGVYSGAGNIDLNFGGKSIQLLRSGNVKAGPVTLDCQQAGRGFHFHTGETRSAVVYGFTITHAHAPDGIFDPVSGNGTHGAEGGGILIEGGSSPTISNCTFSSDSAGNGGTFTLGQGYISGDGGNGGAIAITGGSPLIENCTFMSNSAGQGADAIDVDTYSGNGGNGGAISVTDGTNVVIRVCQFSGNTAGNGGSEESYASGGNGGSGGALAVSGTGTITVQNCLFSDNTAGSGGYGASGANAGNGGGVEIDSSSANMMGCALSGNAAGAAGNVDPSSGSSGASGGAGGGIDANDSTVTITDCQLIGNNGGLSGSSSSFNAGAGGAGGGISLNGGSGSGILRCVLYSNSAGQGNLDVGNDGAQAGDGGSGGGISVTKCSPYIVDCILEGNVAGDAGSYSDNLPASGGDGGGIALQSGTDAAIINCLIVSNSAGAGGFASVPPYEGNGGNGGGIRVDGTSSPMIDNGTIAYNLSGAAAGYPAIPYGANGMGGGLFCGSSGVIVTNSILYFDTDPSGAVNEIAGQPNLSFADVQGDSLDRGNPLFVRKPGTLSNTDPGNLHLQAGSPCIDVGDNADVPHAISTDLDGNARIVNGIVDLGAYEYQSPANVTNQITLSRGGYRYNYATGYFVQTVTLTNHGDTLSGPISLVLDNLSANASLFNKTGVTNTLAPVGSPYINVVAGSLASGASVSVTLEFIDPTYAPINYTTRVLAGPGSR